MSNLPMALAPEDYKALKRAYDTLEYPSFAVRLSSVIGTPIELGLKLLPRRWYQKIFRCAESGVRLALDAAVASLKDKHASRQSSDHYYKMMSLATGAVGGFLGGPALLVELPLTTSIMIRSIVDIARSEGEDIDTLEARVACLQVFALGGRSTQDDAADTGYYGLRLALEVPVSNAARHIAEHGLTNRINAPMLVDLILKVSQRFGVTLSQRMAAKLIPVIGAVGGAVINSLFMQHFQDVARSHFTVRRLERKYCPELIQAEYQRFYAAA